MSEVKKEEITLLNTEGGELKGLVEGIQSANTPLLRDDVINSGLDFVLETEGNDRLVFLAKSLGLEQDIFRNAFKDALGAVLELEFPPIRDVKEMFEQLNVVVVNSNSSRPGPGGKRDNQEEERDCPKTELAATALEEMGISLEDDCRLLEGGTLNTMMRNENYRVFIIPKLNKILLLSDECGHASFMSYEYKDLMPYLEMSIEELENDVYLMELFKKNKKEIVAEDNIHSFNWEEPKESWRETVKKYLELDCCPIKEIVEKLKITNWDEMIFGDFFKKIWEGEKISTQIKDSPLELSYPSELNKFTQIEFKDFPKDGVLETKAKIQPEFGEEEIIYPQDLVLLRTYFENQSRGNTILKRIIKFGIKPVEGVFVKKGKLNYLLFDKLTIDNLCLKQDEEGVAIYNGMAGSLGREIANIRNYAPVRVTDASNTYKKVKAKGILPVEDLLPCVMEISEGRGIPTIAYFKDELEPFMNKTLGEDGIYVHTDGQEYTSREAVIGDYTLSSFNKWISQSGIKPLMDPGNMDKPLRIRIANNTWSYIYLKKDLLKLIPTRLQEDGRYQLEDGSWIISRVVFAKQHPEFESLLAIRSRLEKKNVKPLKINVRDVGGSKVAVYKEDEFYEAIGYQKLEGK